MTRRSSTVAGRTSGGARPLAALPRSSWARLALLRLLGALLAVGLGCEPAAVRPPPAPVLAPPAALPGAEGALASAPAPANIPSSHVFLWRAQVGASTLHLLGSVHVARRELYPLDPRIDSAFAASDVLVLELELDDAAKLGAAQRMMELGRLEPGVRLRDVIAPKTWDLLVQTQERRRGSLFGLRGFRPWFVALTLTTQALESEGFSADQGIDEHFRRRAVGQKRIEALESVEEQLQLFAGLPAATQELMLAQTLEELDQYAEQLDAAFEAWRRGDAAALEALLVEPMRVEYPELFEQLFTQRNRRMLERLLASISARPGHYFLVVGAGHLLGQQGLVDLLRQRGIVVSQQ